MVNSVIIGTGSYIPTRIIKNNHFLNNEFYDSRGNKFEEPVQAIIDKFEKITDIEERRYVTDDLMASDIGYYAAQTAINNSGVDRESLDVIIVAHNFGDVQADSRHSDFMPSLASRIKHQLKINNHQTIAYDLPFGCPGWLEALIHAHNFIKTGEVHRALVVGAETLSRVIDPHDRDSMIYADGAGAVILEAKPDNKPHGILSHKTRSDTANEVSLLRMGKSNNPAFIGNDLFIKMDGRKVYEYALKSVPVLVKECIDKANIPVQEIKKILIHQANGKMDDAILKRLFCLYNINEVPEDIMPMTISRLGNSSVATLPTLIDMILHEKLTGHQLKQNDVIVFASVGAGMNINTVVYKV